MANIRQKNSTFLIEVEKDPDPQTLTVIVDKAKNVNSALENSGDDKFLPQDIPAQLDTIYKEELATAQKDNNPINSPQDLKLRLAATFRERNPVTDAEALRAVDRYLEHRTLALRSEEIKTNTSVKQEGGTPAEDSTFLATVTPTKPLELEDIRQLFENDGGSEHLQAFAHRPGNPPPQLTPKAQFDIFNFDKLKPQKHRYASLRILKPREDINEGGGESSPGFEPLFQTNEFLLQSTTEQRQEKFQIVETFGEPVLFTFGPRHEIYTYAGILLNTENFQWKNKLLKAYDEIVRATKTIGAGARAFLTYDDVMREGHILNLSIQHSVTNLNHVLFTFNMYIIDRIFVGSEESLDNDIVDILIEQALNGRKEEKDGPKLVFPGQVFSKDGDPSLLPDSGKKVAASSSLKNFIKNNMFDSQGNMLSREFKFKASSLGSGSLDFGKLAALFKNAKDRRAAQASSGG